jgi:molybdate transport system substrate-binding protein
MRRWACVLMSALATTLPLALTACGDGDDDATVLTVFAAASLSGPFSELARTFEEQHEGVEVRLSLAGSSDLATQVVEGASADVFASADEPTMRRLTDEGLADEPVVFATNRLQIAVPPGNPAGVESLADLDDGDEAEGADGVALVVCAPAVPCGAAALAVAEVAGVELDPVSEEQSVTDVLGKVASGDADAGLVYVTDVLAADGDVDGVAVPEAASVPNRYPVAVVDGSDQRPLAEEFVALVTGPEGRRTLSDAGFGAP